MKQINAKCVTWLLMSGLIVIACLLCRHFYLENIKEIRVQSESSIIDVLKKSMDKKVKEAALPYVASIVAPDTVPLTIFITSEDGTKTFKVDPGKSKKNISQNRHERFMQSAVIEDNPLSLDSLNLLWTEKLISDRIYAQTTIFMSTTKLNVNASREISDNNLVNPSWDISFATYIGIRCEVEIIANLNISWWNIILYRWTPFLGIIISTIILMSGVRHWNMVKHPSAKVCVEKNVAFDKSTVASMAENVQAKEGEYALRPNLIFAPKRQMLIYQGNEMKFPPQSCVILKLFWDTDEHTLTDDEILENLWGKSKSANIASFRVALNKLCKSLAAVGYPIKFIRVDGEKYCMILPDN